MLGKNIKTEVKRYGFSPDSDLCVILSNSQNFFESQFLLSFLSSSKEYYENQMKLNIISTINHCIDRINY